MRITPARPNSWKINQLFTKILTKKQPVQMSRVRLRRDSLFGYFYCLSCFLPLDALQITPNDSFYRAVNATLPRLAALP